MTPAQEASLDSAETQRVDAAIRERFGDLPGRVLTVTDVGHGASFRGIDRRVEVNVPVDMQGQRIGRHVQFFCLRDGSTQHWTCGEGWAMQWQLERRGPGARQCGPTALGINAGGAGDDALLIDVFDFFSDTATVTQALASTPGCGRQEQETLCRLRGVTTPGRELRGGPDADFAAWFRRPAGSLLHVRGDRVCTGAGPCVIDIVGCHVSTSD